MESQKQILSNPNYNLEMWTEGVTVLGFIGWWSCNNLRYIEHFAIHQDFRSLGYGNRFLSEWMAENDNPIVLEIEPVNDEITLRRQKFYQKLGFQNNNILHFQPAYHADTKSVHLWLMSYPHNISKESYAHFKIYQETKIIATK